MSDFQGLPVSADSAEEIKDAMNTMLGNAVVKDNMAAAPEILELESGASAADILTRMNQLIRGYEALRRRVG